MKRMVIFSIFLFTCQFASGSEFKPNTKVLDIIGYAGEIIKIQGENALVRWKSSESGAKIDYESIIDLSLLKNYNPLGCAKGFCYGSKILDFIGYSGKIIEMRGESALVRWERDRFGEKIDIENTIPLSLLSEYTIQNCKKISKCDLSRFFLEPSLIDLLRSFEEDLAEMALAGVDDLDSAQNMFIQNHPEISNSRRNQLISKIVENRDYYVEQISANAQ